MRDNAILPSEHFLHELGLTVSLAGAPTGVPVAQCPTSPILCWLSRLLGKCPTLDHRGLGSRGRGVGKYLGSGDEWRWSR